MAPDREPRVTEILARMGDDDGARDDLWTLVYDELRSVASRMVRRESPSSTLQPTALVNDVYLRLFGGSGDASWEDRAHFFGTATKAMRQVLVDRARRRTRRGENARVSLEADHGDGSPARECDAVDLVDALDLLERSDPRVAQVVMLRFFGGLQLDEVAELTEVSLATVKRDWSYGRAWLANRLLPADA